MASAAQVDIFPHVPFVERLLFTKHLSIMIKSGITVSEGLETLVDQSKSLTLKNILAKVLADIQNGQSLAKALAKHPKAFDQFYTSLVEVGEESGTLESNLDFLANQLSKDYDLRQKIQAAMLYPAIVLVATSVLGMFTSIFILPKLVDFFASFQADLPISTRILLGFASLMKDHGILIIAGVIGFVFLSVWLVQIPLIKYRWHHLLLHIPLISRLVYSSHLARFSRNLGTLLKSGVPLLNGLQITSQTLDNLPYKQALIKAQEEVKKGKSLASSLENFFSLRTPLYPPLVLKMIAVGEKTGQLDESLLYLGAFYDEDIDNFSKNLATVLEPILLLFIGLIVAFMAIAIISPIYQLTSSIRR